VCFCSLPPLHVRGGTALAGVLTAVFAPLAARTVTA
jgi:hypothetical protein